MIGRHSYGDNYIDSAPETGNESCGIFAAAFYEQFESVELHSALLTPVILFVALSEIL